jgi:hypothetical protein
MMALLWLTLIQAPKIRFVLADVGASYSPGSTPQQNAAALRVYVNGAMRFAYCALRAISRASTPKRQFRCCRKSRLAGSWWALGGPVIVLSGVERLRLEALS